MTKTLKLPHVFLSLKDLSIPSEDADFHVKRSLNLSDARIKSTTQGILMVIHILCVYVALQSHFPSFSNYKINFITLKKIPDTTLKISIFTVTFYCRGGIHNRPPVGHFAGRVSGAFWTGDWRPLLKIDGCTSICGTSTDGTRCSKK